MSGSRWQIPHKSLGDSKETVCVFPLRAAGPRVWLPARASGGALFWMDVGKHQSNRGSVPARHLHELESASLTFPGRREASAGAA